jgi:hypothetical protein
MATKKYTLFTIILAFLLLPFIQYYTHIFKVKELSGWYKKYQAPTFVIGKWFSAEFQDSFTEYFENNFGFRPWFVKLKNQTVFTLFNKVNTSSVVIGQDGYLYEPYYIKAYNGLNYLGDSIILHISDSLNIINNILADKNISLIVCLAAGKGTFYPEYFPDQYLNKRAEKTNYLMFKKMLSKTNINIIDFNELFLKMKDTSQYILYPKYGTHWSEYGAIIAGDSLLHYVEKLRNIDLPDLIIDTIEMTNRLKGSDYDLGKCLNLFFQLPSETMAYPKIRWNTTNKDTCHAIVISDSFYWQLFNKGWSTKAFMPGGFWYYNRISHPGRVSLNDIDYLNSIYHSDIIILMATEATLYKFPFGFSRDFFKKYKRYQEK